MTTSEANHSSTTLVLVEHDEPNLEKGENDQMHRFSVLFKNLPPTWPKTGRRNQKTRPRTCIPSFEEAHIRLTHDPESEVVRVEDLPPKKRKLMDHQFEEIKPNNQCGKINGAFICQRCNKSFVSYQALGGHSAHHKNEVERVVTKSNSLVDCGSGIRMYKCSICSKFFENGHALAGHRRHCLNNQVAIDKPTRLIHEVPKKKTSHLIDINQLPHPPTHQDEDISKMVGKIMLKPKEILRLTWYNAAGGDHASSSANYNSMK